MDMTLPVSPATLTGTGGQFTISPTNTEIGTYSGRIRYYSPVNSGTLDMNFIIDVYPDVDYAHPTPTTTCVSDIYPITLGNYAGITVLDGDYDATNQNFLVCGSTTSTLTARNTGYQSAYVQSYNRNIMVNFQLIFEMGTVQSVMSQCQFGTAGYVFFGINSASTTVDSFNKVHMYKYLHNSAKFVNAKMLGTNLPSDVIELRTMVVEKVTGDQFYAGRIQASWILTNPGEMEPFVLRLSNAMDYMWFRTLQGFTDAYAQTLMTDGTSGVFAHVRSLVVAGKFS
jgi:hypothetical protein